MPLSRRGGLVGLRRHASGGSTVTAGSRPGVAATLWASAGGVMTNSDAAARNIRQTALRNAMPPHDDCYSRRATASALPNPAIDASKRGVRIQWKEGKRAPYL